MRRPTPRRFLEAAALVGLALLASGAFGCARPAIPAERARGYLRAEEGALVFTPCGAARERRVLDRTGGELARTYRGLAPRPGGRVYVELRARPERGGEDAPLAALELRRAAYESAGCADEPQGLRFEASGNEPFWHVEVLAERIRLREPGREEHFALTGLERRGEEGRAVYVARGRGEEGAPLALVLRERRCVDSMSGAHLPYAAELRLGEARLQGCAHEGPAAPGRADAAD